MNFFLNRAEVAAAVVSEVLDRKEKYGSSDLGRGKKVIVEYSSPNIAKPFHIGHIRTTVIGNAIYKILIIWAMRRYASIIWATTEPSSAR